MRIIAVLMFVVLMFSVLYYLIDMVYYNVIDTQILPLFNVSGTRWEASANSIKSIVDSFVYTGLPYLFIFLFLWVVLSAIFGRQPESEEYYYRR